MWPGTSTASGGVNGSPDTTLPPAFFRVQQTVLLSGMSASLNTAPGTGHTVTITVYQTRAVNVPSNTPTATSFTLTFGATDTQKAFYSGSVQFNFGDLIHVYVSYTGSNGNNASDLNLQLDMF